MHLPDENPRPFNSRERRKANLFSTCAVLGFVGVFAAIITDLIAAAVVDGYSIIQQSISSLAAGSYAWIQDGGLYLLSIGTVALAVGLARWRYDEGRLLAGALSLVLIGIDIAVIAYFNEYAGQQNQGANIHINAVYALGILFTACAMLIGYSLRGVARNWAAFSAMMGALWILTAPFFFIVPSAWFGLYERGLALILVCWIGGMCWLLQRRAMDIRRKISMREVVAHEAR
ncbi:DUF998 domain-containing protein [Devosia sp. RR2S18]|uniref:DUF998 domain-containing protein n=1 Tax=Devosia rhizosphaerae TaxID=3049774 RepID=UPI0025401C67|nr:DUF998 domain-containing protein [Devosia sp. RR2S18]WIJ24966.1 DUF998 domain-containing protein [Devosia sp. RR2S18]